MILLSNNDKFESFLDVQKQGLLRHNTTKGIHKTINWIDETPDKGENFIKKSCSYSATLKYLILTYIS